MIMYSYNTLVEAINDLKKRGYTFDFNLQTDCIHCPEFNESFKTDQFEIQEHYRFEGASDPGDLSEVYAVETTSGLKGLITDAVGIYSTLSPLMIKKLSYRSNNK